MGRSDEVKETAMMLAGYLKALGDGVRTNEAREFVTDLLWIVEKTIEAEDGGLVNG